MPAAAPKKIKAVIIGSGFSGICIGIKLKQAGINDFVILEKANSLGGTWRENTYPGAACDIPSALYHYSFEQGFAWETKWSGQKQILEYQTATAKKYGLIPHFEFSQTVESANYNENSATWMVTTSEGNYYSTQHIISAVGQLHHPSTPKFKSAHLYQGDVFHSANWDHDIDIAGKRVAVIGNAASAVQFVPKIAEVVSHLTVFQRSANWMLPKHDRRYTKFEHWLWRKLPFMFNVSRLSSWLLAEHILLPAIKGNRLLSWLLTAECRRSIRKWIKDPEKRTQLTPTYKLGAKRTLFSHDYYRALARDNVQLEVSGIDAFTATGITRRDGQHDDYDVVIYATGFKTNPFLMGLDIKGTSGQSLREVWSEGAHAYLGLATHGFPNLHMMYGPNTNLGHNSIILMIEAQANYIVETIQTLDKNAWKSLEISAEAENTYNLNLQRRLGELVFSKVEHSWYMDGNKITNNWAGGVGEYRKRLANVNWNEYLIS